MNHPTSATAILLVNCADQSGIVSAITHFIAQHQGNIIDLEQHVDSEDQHFFMRVEWELAQFTLPREDILETFNTAVGRPFAMHSQLAFSDQRPRMAMFVSQ